VLMTSDWTGLDVHDASQGVFGPDLPAVYSRWGEFVAWSPAATHAGEAPITIDKALLEAPSPAPQQVFGIGLNYRAHAAESGYGVPDEPPVFTKFASSIAGPYKTVTLPPGGHTDWEVELVVVIGEPTYHMSAADAWSHVAGVCVGQDLSERISQLAGPAPQFSLGKSFSGFTPFGPYLVTADELETPDDLEVGCMIDGHVVQQSRTGDLLFSVPRLIEHLSATLPLQPGDVIFTGKPGGVGLGMHPPGYLQPAETLTTWVQGVGEIEQTSVSAWWLVSRDYESTNGQCRWG